MKLGKEYASGLIKGIGDSFYPFPVGGICVVVAISSLCVIHDDCDIADTTSSPPSTIRHICSWRIAFESKIWDFTVYDIQATIFPNRNNLAGFDCNI
jgi:hypothetical protein